jgi:hypothetical protein
MREGPAASGTDTTAACGLASARRLLLQGAWWLCVPPPLPPPLQPTTSNPGCRRPCTRQRTHRRVHGTPAERSERARRAPSCPLRARTHLQERLAAAGAGRVGHVQLREARHERQQGLQGLRSCQPAAADVQLRQLCEGGRLALHAAAISAASQGVAAGIQSLQGWQLRQRQQCSQWQPVVLHAEVCQAGERAQLCGQAADAIAGCMQLCQPAHAHAHVHAHVHAGACWSACMQWTLPPAKCECQCCDSCAHRESSPWQVAQR